MVTGKKPETGDELPSKANNVIIMGSIKGSKLIQQLIQNKKINVDSIKNKWEAYQIQIIKNPFKGIDQALVIAGSDKRGTAYGVFEMSKEIGVSPWYWWADVPVKKKKEIYVSKNIFVHARPLVKYRGIFINDEAPAFSGWTKEKFGGVNHHVYEKVTADGCPAGAGARVGTAVTLGACDPVANRTCVCDVCQTRPR